MGWQIPLSDIDFGPEESAAVQAVLDSRWLTMGAVTQAFEQEFAAYTRAKHAIAVNNCTAALHLACQVLGLGPGDEVILPALTFVATANAVRYVGATPVFADIESEQNLVISPRTIEPCITSRTRAILVMHYGGYPCTMAEIKCLADKYGLVVIEDAAHAIGSEFLGRKLGTWGQVGCYSFFSNKNMTTGEGGMLVTDNDETASKLRLLRSHGMTAMTWDRHQGHSWSYDVVSLGYNYRIDEIHAALGRVQLAKLDKNNASRRELTALYRDSLRELVPSIGIPFEHVEGVSACHLFPILLPKNVNREAFMERMKADGIQTSIHYPPIHKFQAYRESDPPHLPVTEEVACREVTLPLYPTMLPEQVLVVSLAVRRALQELPAG
jgi:dTDP-4-amino-4,6-dideoxygalactose transaminase